MRFRKKRVKEDDKLMVKGRFSRLIRRTLSVLTGVVLTLSVLSESRGVNAAELVQDTPAATNQVAVVGALIQGANVVVGTSGLAATDDGLYHLYAQETYQFGATGVEVASAPANAAATFTFALNKNTAASNLYKKFTVVGVQGGTLKVLSNSMFITNPEAVATHTAIRNDSGKKGIYPAASATNGTFLTDMGIKKCCWTLNAPDFFAGGGVDYVYNGKPYSFNATLVGQYDFLASAMKARGIQLSLIIVNGWSADLTMVHPAARGGGGNYYAFNVCDQAGIERLEALGSFLGSRYGSDSKYGPIDNYIIGNEVNATEWNYLPKSQYNITAFTAEYEKAFRLLYNGIKSENGSANVYISLDQEWLSNGDRRHFGVKEFLDNLNTIATSQGNYDWAVNDHPYNFPLYCPTVWAQLNQGSKVTHSQNSPYVTMQNIDVLTDYLCQPALLSPTGQVRSVLISEVAYTSIGGAESQQAASMVYAYRQCELNQYIDGFIYGRQLDHPTEIAQSRMADGLFTSPDGFTTGSPKIACSWFQQMDGPNAAAVRAQAASVIGVSDLDSLMSPR